MGKVREKNMAKAMAAAIPLPTKRVKTLVQGLVDADVLDAVRAEADKQGVTIRSVVEWGIKQYLMTTNPQKAKDLGL